jgi:hypothetical protein
MTTVVSTSNSEVPTSTSYVSRWIAQSHNTYPKKTNEFYSPSSSSCDFRTPTGINKPPPVPKPHTTTWQAQAKSRLDAAAIAATTPHDSLLPSSININNNELQEKLQRVR